MTKTEMQHIFRKYHNVLHLSFDGLMYYHIKGPSFIPRPAEVYCISPIRPFRSHGKSTHHSLLLPSKDEQNRAREAGRNARGTGRGGRGAPPRGPQVVAVVVLQCAVVAVEAEAHNRPTISIAFVVSSVQSLTVPPNAKVYIQFLWESVEEWLRYACFKMSPSLSLYGLGDKEDFGPEPRVAISSASEIAQNSILIKRSLVEIPPEEDYPWRMHDPQSPDWVTAIRKPQKILIVKACFDQLLILETRPSCDNFGSRRIAYSS
ncbi:hypothetical protein C8J56DRAFT_887081 [Mycena floridula]|nr:hypothetical protein C8J56DRAFT_887081 [Mycena floridula]